MHPLLALLSRVLLFFIPLGLQERYHFFQYAYFLRIPLLLGLGLICLPRITTHRFPTVAHNLFDLDGIGLFLVTVLSLMLAWVVMYTFGLIYVTVPERYKLTFNRDQHRAQKKLGQFANPVPKWLERDLLGVIPLRHLVFGLLAGPLIWTSYDYSTSGDHCNLFAVFPDSGQDCRFVTIGAGILTALVLWGAITLLGHWFIALWQHRILKPVREPLGRSFVYVRETVSYTQGVFSERLMLAEHVHHTSPVIQRRFDTNFTKAHAKVHFCLTAGFYVAGFFLLSPVHFRQWPSDIPPLVYILMLLMLFGWILPRLTLTLDMYRVPVVAVLVAIPLLFHEMVGADYYYRLTGVQEIGTLPRTDFLGAYGAWESRHPSGSTHPTMVVVAASGGGIAASRWTAEVLTKLEQQEGLKGKFADSIFIISATSGGGIGSMYFVDEYQPSGFPQDVDLNRVVDRASRSTSGAIGWGIVYPDFFRLFPIPPRLFNDTYDRAWAQEERWAQPWRLSNAQEPTLRSWQIGVKEGWRPILVFNATISETGEQLLLTPIDISTSEYIPTCAGAGAVDPAYRTRGLFDLYPDVDMPVTTAARLSATFPFLSPIARPTLPNNSTCPAFHVADGGYFDNFGVVTAINFLDRVLEKDPHKRVLFLQIRAYPSKNLATPLAGTTVSDELIGPFSTMYNVRGASQLVRNDRDIELLKDRWAAKNVDILDVVFELQAESPLSWHLTQREKDHITRHFAEDQRSICLVKAFVGQQQSSAASINDCTRLHRAS